MAVIQKRTLTIEFKGKAELAERVEALISDCVSARNITPIAQFLTSGDFQSLKVVSKVASEIIATLPEMVEELTLAIMMAMESRARLFNKVIYTNDSRSYGLLLKILEKISRDKRYSDQRERISAWIERLQREYFAQDDPNIKWKYIYKKQLPAQA